MKKAVLVCLVLAFSQTLFAQAGTICGCYETETFDPNFYHVSGRMTATMGKAVVQLTHGKEIFPEANSPVTFRFTSVPPIKERCKNTYLIAVRDEKDNQRVVYTTHSDSLTEFSYTFPNCDRDYTVTLQVTATNKTNTIDPQFLRDQDCQRILVAIVHPKCKPASLKKSVPFKKN